MKKAYVKPVLYFENFELNTGIAACKYVDHGNTTLTTKNSCGWNDGAVVVFVNGVQACAYEVQDEFSGVCYNSFANNIFGS